MNSEGHRIYNPKINNRHVFYDSRVDVMEWNQGLNFSLDGQ